MLTKVGEIEIIDGIIDDKDFLEIKEVLMSRDFPWYTSTVIDNPKEELRNIQLVHEFYKYMKPLSKAFDTFGPILEKIDPVALLRIKANLLVGTDRIVEHGMHTDVNEYVPGMRTGILYMNTCNGYTRFDDEDNTCVQSVANRFVHFPAYIKHTGTTTTDSKVRVVVNFNYIHTDEWQKL
jgi:hypothetical protein